MGINNTDIQHFGNTQDTSYFNTVIVKAEDVYKDIKLNKCELIVLEENLTADIELNISSSTNDKIESIELYLLPNDETVIITKKDIPLELNSDFILYLENYFTLEDETEYYLQMTIITQQHMLVKQFNWTFNTPTKKNTKGNKTQKNNTIIEFDKDQEL